MAFFVTLRSKCAPLTVRVGKLGRAERICRGQAHVVRPEHESKQQALLLCSCVPTYTRTQRVGRAFACWSLMKEACWPHHPDARFGSLPTLALSAAMRTQTSVRWHHGSVSSNLLVVRAACLHEAQEGAGASSSFSFPCFAVRSRCCTGRVLVNGSLAFESLVKLGHTGKLLLASFSAGPQRS